MQRDNKNGYSLLEVLLVMAMVVSLVALALPSWREQQYTVRRPLAWLQLQHIALAQSEYKQQTGNFATSLTQLGVPTQDDAYGYSLQVAEESHTIQAKVLSPGPSQGDKTCWQLVWSSMDGAYSLDQLGGRSNGCR